MPKVIKKFIDFFSSLRLTVVCLAIAMVLVFVGTIAQVELGLYQAQNQFFRSFFVVWGPKAASWKIILPGGYLLGSVLLINLIAAHIKRFSFSRKKIGIFMVHAGLILMLAGQLVTDLLSVESGMHIREGESKNYSETERTSELAIIDVTSPDTDKVVSIPGTLLTKQKDVSHSELPFKIHVKDFYANSFVTNRAPNAVEAPRATQGVGTQLDVKPLPKVTAMNFRDVPSAVIEIVSPQGSLGTWVVSEFLNSKQFVDYAGKKYEIALRPMRHYKPFSLHLIDFKHDLYPGTQTPKNFSSRVRIEHTDTKESRETLIYMNNPLRHGGETFFQADFDKDNLGTILQVVRNPGWLTPYISCALVGLGLVVQFMSHLIGFARKRIAS